MATYSDPHYDGFPNIHRHRAREGWKTDDLTRDSFNLQHRNLLEMQDQVRFQKDELRRKDELIRELQGLEAISTDYLPHPSQQQHHQVLPGGLTSCPTARSDLAALQARLDTLSSRLRDREAELGIAGDTIRDLRAELGRRRDSEGDRAAEDRRVLDFAARVHHNLGALCPANDFDVLAAKVAELVKENVDMKAKIHVLTDQQDKMELEARTNKQTIERLLAEVNREFRATFQLQASETVFKTETEKIKEENEQLKKKVELLEIQLGAEKGAVAAGKTALQEKEAQFSKLDCEKREAVHNAETLGKQLSSFVDSLATLLSTAYSRVPSAEEAVREKVRQLLSDVRSHSSSMAVLEERVKSVTGQLEQQLEANRQREQRGQQADAEAKELRDKLRAVEAELAAGDVIRDSLRGDKDRLYKYLQRLGQALNLEGSAIDVSYDVLGEGLVERAEQLTRQGGACCGCENGGGLRKRVQALKEQLESKDLHLELMRRRLSQAEGGGVGGGGGGGGGVFSPTPGGLVGGPGGFAAAADFERERARKAERRLEKARRLLEEARLEAGDLRAQLDGLGELKAAASRQDRDLEQLEAALEKLERVRQKQAQRIAALKAQLGQGRREADEGLQCLSDELRAARRELDEAARRERQLAELRSAVARMLLAGTDAVAMSDAEIVARLERLLWQQRQRDFQVMQPQQPPQQPPQLPPQLPPPAPHHYHSCEQLQQYYHCPSNRCGGCGGVGGGCDCRRDRERRSRRHSSSGRSGGGVRSSSCGPEYRRY